MSRAASSSGTEEKDATAAHAQPERPNIIVLMTDNQWHGDLNGGVRADTPAINQLAAWRQWALVGRTWLLTDIFGAQGGTPLFQPMAAKIAEYTASFRTHDYSEITRDK